MDKLFIFPRDQHIFIFAIVYSYIKKLFNHIIRVHANVYGDSKYDTQQYDCYNSQTVKKYLIIFAILPRRSRKEGAREGPVKVRHHLSDATRTLSVDHADGLSFSSQHSRRTVPFD